MSLHQNFPNLLALPRCNAMPDAHFDWNDANPLILREFWNIQERLQANPAELLEWTNAIIQDLHNARTETNEQVAVDAIDCARFVTCAIPIHTTLKSGQHGDCYHWIWTAISHTHIFGERGVQENQYNYLMVDNLFPDLQMEYFDCLPNFISAIYHLSYKLGGLDRLTSEIATVSWETLARLRTQNTYRDDTMAISQMLIWAAYQNWPDGQLWAQYVLERYNQCDDPEEQKTLAMIFISPANTYSNETSEYWAQRILDQYHEHLREIEELQILCVLIQSMDLWNTHRCRVFNEILRIRTEFLQNLVPGESILEVLEQRVSILNPLFFSLARFAPPQVFISILNRWYNGREDNECDGDILVIMPTYNGSASYIWPNGRLINQVENLTPHNEMQRALGRALGEYIRGADGDHQPQDYFDFRFEHPDPQEADALEAAMSRNYRFEELAERLPENWVPRAILIFPSGPEPVQALFSKQTGMTPALELSLQRKFEVRPIRRIGIWLGEVFHGQFEIDSINQIAALNGWDVSLYNCVDYDIDGFRRFYEDESFDIIWIISHSEYNPYSVRGTYIDLGATHSVLLEELKSYEVPERGRRLLVLNSCSSAKTQGRGGIGKIGIAQTLVSQSQSVCGNLWPISMDTGFVFGATLAASLSEHGIDLGVLKAISLFHNREGVRRFISNHFAEDRNLCDRLTRANEGIQPLTSWGCPVYLI